MVPMSLDPGDLQVNSWTALDMKLKAGFESLKGHFTKCGI